MFASQSGHVESVRALIEKGASLEDYWAALELAEGKGHGEVVAVLILAGIAAGQDVNAWLGRVISVYLCTGAWVLLQMYVGSEGGIELDLI